MSIVKKPKLLKLKQDMHLPRHVRASRNRAWTACLVSPFVRTNVIKTGTHLIQRLGQLRILADDRLNLRAHVPTQHDLALPWQPP